MAWIEEVLAQNLGEVLLNLGQFEEACHLTGSAMTGLGMELGEKHFRFGVAQNVHGYCMGLSGEVPAQAFELMEQGYSVIRATKPAGEGQRIDAIKRLISLSSQLRDDQRHDRYTVLLEEERQVLGTASP